MSSNCQVDLQIDPPSPNRTVYVPLDIIQGQAVIKVNKEITISNIQIKLLGQTFTTITRRVRRRDGKQRTQTNQESHEVVFDVDTVFPPDEIKRISQTPQFTLTPGVYKYPFKFQLPLNATCGDPDSAKIYSNRLNSEIEQLHENTHSKHGHYQGRYVSHIMAPLPPSCKGSVFGMVGNCGYGVKYELKCTVRRASMFKTNFREIKRIIVLPFDFGVDGISASGFQTVEHVIFKNLEDSTNSAPGLENTNGSSSQKSSSFMKFFKSPITTHNKQEFSNRSQLPLKVNVQFTGNCLNINTDPIKSISLSLNNLDLILGKQSSGKQLSVPSIYLRSLEITLKSQTNFKAEDFNEIETLLYEVLKLDYIDLEIPLRPNSSSEVPLDLSKLFKESHPLIPIVPPSFQTCSIIKVYWLEFQFKFVAEKSDTQVLKISHSTGQLLLSSGIPVPPSSMINVNFVPPAPPNNFNNMGQQGPSSSTVSYQSPPGPPPVFSKQEPAASRPGESEAAREKREVEEWFAKNQHLYDEQQTSNTGPVESNITVEVEPNHYPQFTSSLSNSTNAPTGPSSSTAYADQMGQINQRLESMGIDGDMNIGSTSEQLPSYQEVTSRRRS